VRAALKILHLLDEGHVMGIVVSTGVCNGFVHVCCTFGSAHASLHDATASVVLAVPHDLNSGSLVETQTERKLVLPQLAWYAG